MFIKQNKNQDKFIKQWAWLLIFEKHSHFFVQKKVFSCKNPQEIHHKKWKSKWSWGHRASAVLSVTCEQHREPFRPFSLCLLCFDNTPTTSHSQLTIPNQSCVLYPFYLSFVSPLWQTAPDDWIPQNLKFAIIESTTNNQNHLYCHYIRRYNVIVQSPLQ